MVETEGEKKLVLLFTHFFRRALLGSKRESNFQNLTEPEQNPGPLSWALTPTCLTFSPVEGTEGSPVSPKDEGPQIY
jgi:hypothetical protein